MPAQESRSGAKRRMLSEVWKAVKARGEPYTTDNKEIKQITGEAFRNQFDLTKIDSTDLLSEEMQSDDVFLAHLGQGRHQFFRGISLAYHEFESPGRTLIKRYHPGALTLLDDTREAGILSTLFNERVVHEFLYGDIKTEARIHLPGRSRAGTFSYKIGASNVVGVRGLQVELDFILEATLPDRPLDVCIAEAKVTDSEDFNISQIYLPFRKLATYRHEHGANFEIRSMFVRKTTRRLDGPGYGVPPGRYNCAVLYEYGFDDLEDMASIGFVKADEYVLVPLPRPDSFRTQLG